MKRSTVMDHLTKDEYEYLEKNLFERCESCRHLKIFHNYHCCAFCMIDGCDCKFEKGYNEDEN